jgi:Holliday junction resolvase
MKATDDQILAAYAEGGSAKKAGALLGMNSASGHERLARLGAAKPINVFTDDDRARLKREYHVFADAGRLKVLATSMGRTVPFICRQARVLGLTDQKRIAPYVAKWKYMSVEAVAAIWDDFQRSSLGLGQYCRKRGYDDLGFSRKMQEIFPDEYEHVIELKAPKQSRYRYGRQFEYRVRDDLKSRGYFALRSPASKSPLDVLAVKHGCVLMVQAKRGGALPPKEWNPLFDLASSVGAIPVLAVEPPGNRGVSYFRLSGRKSGNRGERQPMEVFEP